MNLTDGLDGLAAGCAAIVLLAYIGDHVHHDRAQRDLALLAGCLVGACVGFLWFNSFPASIFMGDTGSLGLGGAIAGLAVMTKTEILLIILGGIFVIEALSVADPGLLVPDLPQARVPDGADPPPLRAARRGRRRRSSCASGSSPSVCAAIGFTIYQQAIDAVSCAAGRCGGAGASQLLGRRCRPGRTSSSASPARASAAALALRARGEEVIGCDARRAASVGEACGRRASRCICDDAGVAAASRAPRTLVKSPGVPREAPVVAAARERGLAVIGELELGWRLLPNEFVAVTGTNGKTTTVELIGHIHRAAGAAGRGRRQRRHRAGRRCAGDGSSRDATVVCEASSFQLEDTVAFAPEAAVLLNLAEDHLDRHGTFDAYRDGEAAASSPARAPDDVAVVPVPTLAVERPRRRARRGVRSATAPAPTCARRATARCGGAGEPLHRRRRDPPARRAQPRERDGGRGRRARARRRRRTRCATALRDLRRRRAPARGGRRRATASLYVNDSKATNVAAALVALRVVRAGGVHLILGGRGKGADFAPLAAPVASAARRST